MANKRQPKLTQLQREFLEKALAFYEQFAAERGDSPQSGFDASRTALGWARIQRSLGMLVESEGAFRLSISQLKELTARFPSGPTISTSLAGHSVCSVTSSCSLAEFSRPKPSQRDPCIYTKGCVRVTRRIQTIASIWPKVFDCWIASFEIRSEAQMSSPLESGGGDRAW